MWLHHNVLICLSCARTTSGSYQQRCCEHQGQPPCPCLLGVRLGAASPSLLDSSGSLRVYQARLKWPHTRHSQRSVGGLRSLPLLVVIASFQMMAVKCYLEVVLTCVPQSRLPCIRKILSRFSYFRVFFGYLHVCSGEMFVQILCLFYVNLSIIKLQQFLT